MIVLYYLSFFLMLAVVVAAVIGLVKPSLFKSVLKGRATRPRILIGGAVLFLVFAILLTVTEPASVKQARFEREQAAQQSKQLQQQEKAAQEAKQKADEEEARNKETTQEVKETQTVQFSDQTKEDGGLARGQTKVVQEGQNGEKTVTYTVTYKGSQEVSRTVKSEEVTKQPVPRVTAVGTYVAPAAPSAGSGYTNSQGNHVPSPSSNPAGATAKCRDGTYSYSQSRRGTCSHHGGVAQWL